MLDRYNMYTERYGSTKDVAQELRIYSKESEPEEEDKKNLAVAAQQSACWAGVRPICAFSCGSMQRRYDAKLV